MPSPAWFEYRLLKTPAKAQKGLKHASDSLPGSSYGGWRKTACAAALVTTLVLVVNLGSAIFLNLHFRVSGEVGTLYEGECADVKKWSTGIHLFINILGTAVLAASNFCMQCLSSPTRAEVDVAHAHRKSLSIGQPSVANLWHVAKWKRNSWLLLCLSSLPLHLLWNSTVFMTIGTNRFDLIVADRSFLEEQTTLPGLNRSIEDILSYHYTQRPLLDPVYYPSDTGCERSANHVASLYKAFRAGNYTEASAEQCLDYYTATRLGDRRNLIIITDSAISSNTSFCDSKTSIPKTSIVPAIKETGKDMEPEVDWILSYGHYEMSRSFDLQDLRNQMSIEKAWFVGDYAVEYCLIEERVDPRCKLQFVSYFLYIVVVCNTIKLMCMTLVVYKLWSLRDPVLATVGDATASFLEYPDATTVGWCILDGKALSRGAWSERRVPHQYDRTYHRKPWTRYHNATSKKRWWSTMTACTLFLICAYAMFSQALANVSGPAANNLLRPGFGEVNKDYLFNIHGGSDKGLVSDVLIANLFQLSLSTTYFLYNSLYTAQCSAKEWSSYADSPKPLRVTCPQGQQKSTFYLQLPYAYSIPLIGLSILMHFLISQSVFLARLQTYNSDGEFVLQESFTDVGWSPSGTITSLCVWTTIIAIQVWHSQRKLDNRVPLHQNSSAVISAMCHSCDATGPSDERQDIEWQTHTSIATQELTWGVTKVLENPMVNLIPNDGSVEGFVGHCSFTRESLGLPTWGHQYA